MADESYVDYVTIGGTKRKLRDSVSRELCQKAADNAKAEVDALYAADRESWAEQVDAAATTARNAADTANTKASEANAAASTATAATASANAATDTANAAAADALKAAEEARGSISPEKKLYLTFDTVGDTEYLTLIDTEE